MWHPGLSSNTAPEAVAYRLEVAEAAVSLMLEVFTGWAENPSNHVRAWASQFAPSVASLVNARDESRAAEEPQMSSE